MTFDLFPGFWYYKQCCYEDFCFLFGEIPMSFALFFSYWIPCLFLTDSLKWCWNQVVGGAVRILRRMPVKAWRHLKETIVEAWWSLRRLPMRLKGKWESGFGNWRKRDSCYAVAEGLATPLLAVMWQVEFVLNELDDLAKEISRKNVEIPPSFFLAAYTKMQ